MKEMYTEITNLGSGSAGPVLQG